LPRLTIIGDVKAAVITALFPLLASCASSGFYNMSGTWCAAHVEATPARCPEHADARRVAANKEHTTATEVAVSD